MRGVNEFHIVAEDDNTDTGGLRLYSKAAFHGDHHNLIFGVSRDSRSEVLKTNTLFTQIICFYFQLGISFLLIF